MPRCAKPRPSPEHRQKRDSVDSPGTSHHPARIDGRLVSPAIRLDTIQAAGDDALAVVVFAHPPDPRSS